MYNISEDRQTDKDRVMYVNNLITFLDDDDKDGDDYKKVRRNTNVDPNGIPYYYLHTILGEHDEERALFEYAVNMGISTLILYNVTRLLRVGGEHYDLNSSRLTYAQELDRFITIAKQVYGLEIGIAAPEASRISNMWDNMLNFYDIYTAGIPAALDPVTPCDGSWFVYDGGSLPGGFFRVGDIPRVYPEDGEGRTHPYDELVIDVVNVYYYRFNSFSREDWWQEIWDQIRLGYEDIIDENHCFRTYVPVDCKVGWVLPLDPDDETEPVPGKYILPCIPFEQQICHSFNRIVTEYEFWLNKNYPFPDLPNNDKVYNIEISFKEFQHLLKMMKCMEEHIVDYPESDDFPQQWQSCPIYKDAYLMRFTSSNYTYNGKKMGNEHYVMSDWVISPGVYHDLSTYDFDAANQGIADIIDERVDRIYLDTYKQSPCQMWSDDIRHNETTYRRRFKDMYSYFSGNGIGKLANDLTEIYPLFSARHPEIEDVPKDPHLGLFLAHVQCRGLNIAENLFDYFSQHETFNHVAPNNLMVVPCDNTTSPNNQKSTNPHPPIAGSPLNIDVQSGNHWSICGFAGDYFVMDVAQDGYYDLSTTSSETFLTVWEGHPQNNNVVMFGVAPLYVELLDGHSYYVSINRHVHSTNQDARGACGVNTTTSGITCRTIDIDFVSQKNGFYTRDPKPDEIGVYDNVINGYAWYRYRELGGKNNKYSQALYKNNPTTSNEIVEKKLNTKYLSKPK